MDSVKATVRPCITTWWRDKRGGGRERRKEGEEGNEGRGGEKGGQKEEAMSIGLLVSRPSAHLCFPPPVPSNAFV